MPRPKFITMARHAKSALLAAVEIYNKPVFPHREQTCVILLVSAWELLIQARIIQESGRLEAIYQKDGRRHRKDGRRHKRDRKTISLHQALGKVSSIPSEAKSNIRGLIVIRNRAVHFGNLGTDVQDKILGYGAASVQNFIRLSDEWFGERIEVPYLLPVGFIGDARLSAGRSRIEQRKLIAILEKISSTAESSGGNYAVTLHVEIKLNPKFTGGGSIGVTGDINAPKVQVKEDDMMSLYHATYKDVVAECRKRYTGFKQNERFHLAMKSVKEDRSCVFFRTFNPLREQSNGQMFYNLEATLSRLDEEYGTTE